MIKLYYDPISEGTTVKLKIGKEILTGQIDKILKPSYIFKDTDQYTLRYIVKISDENSIVVPHVLINKVN